VPSRLSRGLHPIARTPPRAIFGGSVDVRTQWADRRFRRSGRFGAQVADEFLDRAVDAVGVDRGGPSVVGLLGD